MRISASNHRQLLFSAGAEAFSHSQPDVLRSRPDVRGWYVCPLCLHAFPPEALAADPPRLTLDEAPSKASTRGPIAKVLTCKACNNQAGGRLEWDLKQRRIAEDFLAGRLTKPTRVGLEDGDGTRVSAEATFVGGTLEATGYEAATDPDDFASHWAWWEKQVDEAIPGAQFKIHMTPYDHGRSQIALIKAGYLAAFAAFGYTYIWRPQLDSVRNAIRDPGGGHMRRFPVLTARYQDPTVHRILSATEPLRGVCLQIGQDFVFLPGIDDSPRLFWEAIDEPVGTITFVPVSGWPRFPEYRLDHQGTAHDV